MSTPPDRSPKFYAGVAFAVSMAVLVLKLSAWLLSDSVVLMADAAESSMDVATALMLVLAVRYSSQPADDGHPFGHGKVEYFSSGFQGALILAAGAGVVTESIRRATATPEALELGLGLGFSVLATLINLALALTMIRVGTQLRSPALAADGRHNITDVATTLGGWAGLGLAWVTGWWLLDPIVALLVGAQILWAGVTLIRGAVAGLMDAAIPDEERDALYAALQAALEGQAGCHLSPLRTRRSSDRTFIDCTLSVPGTMTVEASHALCDALEAAAARVIPGSELRIHVEPAP